jgi:hypothetical protein
MDRRFGVSDTLKVEAVCDLSQRYSQRAVTAFDEQHTPVAMQEDDG